MRQPVTPSVTHHTVSRVTRAPMLWDHASTQHVTDITAAAGTREVAREEGRERDAAVDWMVFLCCCAAELLPDAHCSGNPPGMKLVTHHDKGSWISNIYTNRFSLAITFHKISFVDIIILNFISVLSCDVMRLYTALTLLHEQDA